ncbi:serpin family protein [Evansella cellulosilytica]|uniref:Proteinase inhibitor I4 serpin n=1 Tax=Evansella cellulosilytica (strain ATCC 21833 / DSM 2522 / FERM P-1141 / JCM 9156 / N-4) TaxID=649639 RepID=E6TXJ1_EVAC2|nr:serpin family protein [Evansella cellulosilytica]ADU28805.1 proteinase inhibitor I4 serpin [Evansella cellulosilytica DSM 2522]
MKKIITITIMLIYVVILLVGCGSNEDKSNFRTTPERKSDISDGQQKFAFDLISELENDLKENENMFISPMSISIALAMVVNGAEGETKEEILQTLHLNELSDEVRNEYYKQLIMYLENHNEDFLMSIANSIWSDDKFEAKEPFITENKEMLFSEVREQPLLTQQTVDDINEWASENTNGNIEKIFDSVNDMHPEVVMYLINAIYLKGNWELPFNEEMTKKGTFYNVDNTESTIDFMWQSAKYSYTETRELQAVRLPYANSNAFMTIVLPKHIDKFEINESKWKKINHSFDEEMIDIKMPKFTLEYENEMSNYLKNLGIEKAFNKAQSDFSRITDDPRFVISRVLHNTFVEVDEKGSEAAAVTAIEAVAESSIVTKIPEMVINRPFYIFIHDEEFDVILFAGRINTIY